MVGHARLRRAAALAAIGVLIAACSGGGERKQPSLAAAAQATPAACGAPAPACAATPDLPFPIATPQRLPVTPISIKYTVAEPKFDPLPGTRAIYGEYSGGGYRIEVPGRWNGDVVYFAHGFRGTPPQLTVTPPPIRAYLIDHGYAWAASSYTKNGYEPGAGARDTYALRDVFAQKVGTPKRSYIYGQSMGGHIVALSREEYPTAYDGALSECGVVAGHEILDYFLSWGALASYFSGADLVGASVSGETLGAILRSKVGPALGTPDKPTEQGKEFADAIENLTGGPRPFFRQGFALNYVFNFVTLVNAVAAAGPANAAADNTHTVYRIDTGFPVTSDQLNRAVPRVEANRVYTDRATYPEFAPLTGDVQRPLLSLHGTGDLFVPISIEESYRRIADAAGRGDLLVQRAIRRAGHCNFSDQEREQAFDDLVDWVEHGKKPDGDNLLGDLRDIGRKFTTPLEPNDPGGLTP